jgi:hypothetical protein
MNKKNEDTFFITQVIMRERSNQASRIGCGGAGNSKKCCSFGIDEISVNSKKDRHYTV